MAFTYLDVLKRICASADDPDATRLKSTAKAIMLRVINQLIEQENFKVSDVVGFHKLQAVQFTAYVANIASNKVMKVLTLLTLPSAAETVYFRIKDLSYVAQIGEDTNYEPAKNEAIIYRVGNALYMIRDSSYTGSGSLACSMEYIEQVDNSSWGDSTDLSDLFSIDFLSRVESLSIYSKVSNLSH